MKTWTRSLVTAMVAGCIPAAAAAGGVVSAVEQPTIAAETPDSCTNGDYPPNNYPPQDCTPEPTLTVQVLSPLCEHDTPYLYYRLSVTGTPNTLATITFQGAGGQQLVYQNQPLAGKLLWPGAEVSAAGETTDWPGWTKNSDGTWSEGDQWDWARDPLTVLFEVNPSASAAASYPEATPQCTADPGPEVSPNLETGFVLPATL